MQTLAIISSIKNFNKHVLIDHFHLKHETRKKEVIELSLQEITSNRVIEFLHIKLDNFLMEQEFFNLSLIIEGVT